MLLKLCCLHLPFTKKKKTPKNKQTKKKISKIGKKKPIFKNFV